MLGYDLAGRMLANRSSFLLRTTITSAALSPTGAFKHASDDFIDWKVSSGSALPNFSNAESPAASDVTLF